MLLTGSFSDRTNPSPCLISLSVDGSPKEKRQPEFEPGQRLRFVRKTRKFERGETVEVVATVENGLRVRRPDGLEVDFIPSGAASSFDVGEARELESGRWCTGCCCRPTTAKSSSMASACKSGRSENDRIALADGRQLPAGFNTFTHGYAVTS